MSLALESNLSDADTIYQALIALHEGKSEDESRKANARLILLLINHIGENPVILQAIKAADGALTGKE